MNTRRKILEIYETTNEDGIKSWFVVVNGEPRQITKTDALRIMREVEK